MRVTVVLGGRKVVCRLPIYQDALFASKTLALMDAKLPDIDPADEAAVDAAANELDEETEIEIRTRMRELVRRLAVSPKCIDEDREDEPTDVVNLREVSDADVARAWGAITVAAGLSREAAREIAPLSQTAPSSSR